MAGWSEPIQPVLRINGMENKTLARALLFLATITFVIAPAFTPPFRGYDPALFPVQIDRPAIQPAGYAFAIWGLIYLWLILHAGFGLLKRRDSTVWARPVWPTIGAVALGTVWLAIATSAPITATIAIVIMAALAATALLRADAHSDRWLLSAPLAIFAGWVTAASAVSLGVMIAGYGMMSNTSAALAMLLLVLLIATTIQSRCPKMPLYGATVTWAIVGILVANQGVNSIVMAAAAMGTVLMAGITVWLARRPNSSV